MARNSNDFPAPDGPPKAMHSPPLRVKLAGLSPGRLRLSMCSMASVFIWTVKKSSYHVNADLAWG